MRILRLSAVLLVSILAYRICAGDEKGPDVPNAESAAGFFRLGENSMAHTWTIYYETIADKIDDRWKSFFDLAQKLGAPKQTMDALAEVKKNLSALPLGKAYGQWTADEQKKFISFPSNADPIFDWIKKPDYQALFYFDMGRLSLEGYFVIQKLVLDQGYSIDSYKSTIQAIGNDAEMCLTDTGFEAARKRLAPAALQILKDIRALKGKLDDPLGEGFTKDDVAKLAQLCKSLSTMARENKLLAEAEKPK
ncbi:MAG TPA: hypothetical protein VKX17_13955 [Planctomycetota bacterium]|nr:hypothetical protein [Planctomycetota bacterium]